MSVKLLKSKGSLKFQFSSEQNEQDIEGEKPSHWFLFTASDDKSKNVLQWDFSSIINIFEMNFQEWKIPFHSSEFFSESWAKKIVVVVDAMAIIW